MARTLHKRGWRVRALNRKPEAVRRDNLPEGIAWETGDAMREVDVVRAAAGATLIVHAVNPPGYRNWGQLVLPMIDNTIAAARSVGARILLPGTVYNYGQDAFPVADERAPQHPLTRKGAIRKTLEQRLEAAAATGVRSLVVRAGDFFGPHAGNSWFAQALVTPGKPVTRILRPNGRGVGHQWAFLPDIAETMARLVERDAALAPFATYHMDGHWDPDGTAMVAAIRRVAQTSPSVWPFPWWALTLAAPFNETMRELREMRYLWQKPLRLDNAKLRAELGTEPHTPLDAAVRATLVAMKCLPSSTGSDGSTA